MRKWYTVKQMAEMLQISLTTAYALIHSGQVRAVKVGAQYRIPAATLDELVA